MEDPEKWWKKDSPEAMEDKLDEKKVIQDESSEDDQPVEKKSIPGIGTWVVSISRDRTCLHIIGKCHRVPEVHYYLWKEVKPDVKDDCFKKACKVCFPRGHPVFSSEPLEEIDDELDVDMPPEAAMDDGESSSSE